MLRFIAQSGMEIHRGRLGDLESLIHDVYERVIHELGIPRRKLRLLRLVHQELPRLSPTANYQYNRLVYICYYPDIVPAARQREINRVFLEATQRLQIGMMKIWG